MHNECRAYVVKGYPKKPREHHLYLTQFMLLQIFLNGHRLNFAVMTVITSLAKEVMFSVALVSLSVCLFVCLSVCLSVDNITQKVMNGLG